ncbi:MAG: 1-acyl-sn-glycerol-3-phosphate acyltransferase [Candidatus Marinimicrobia bacterium]|nr:1-acyl-sn-glycerol-3-phosphate acyltransferase [Candidatus Neomarinimicrobiota bacterium]
MIYVKTALLMLYTFLLSIVALIQGVFDRPGKHHGKVQRQWARVVLRLAGVKVDVEGLENLKDANPALIVMNHESALDIPVAIAALPISLRFIFKRELLQIPFFGWALWQGKHIPINRSKPKQAIQTINKKSAEIFQRGYNIIIAPEGTRSVDGKIGKFKKGGFKIAEQYNLPVIAITMIGNRFCNPKGAMTIIPGTVKALIHPAVKISDFDDIDHCMNFIREKMIDMKNKHEKTLEEAICA